MGNSSEALNEQNVDISFCLPVYNVSSFISQCIDSIILQDRGDIKIEILCVDDCSQDDSVEVLERLSVKYPEIRVVKNKENHGVSYSRNIAVKEAKGKWIWFVDPDDMLYPGAYPIMYNEAEKCDCDVILGQYRNITEKTCLSDVNIETFKSDFAILTNYSKQCPTDENGKPAASVWLGMYKHSFLADNSLKFCEKMIVQEDTLFTYEVLLKTNNIIIYNGPCYLYRSRSTSVMHTRSDERNKKYYISMVALLEVYEEHLATGNYRDKDFVLRKIQHCQQNIALCLLCVKDTAYVRKELKMLKRKKLYPYKFRKEALKGKENLFRKLAVFMLPIEPIFWLVHLAYKMR